MFCGVERLRGHQCRQYESEERIRMRKIRSDSWDTYQEYASGQDRRYSLRLLSRQFHLTPLSSSRA